MKRLYFPHTRHGMSCDTVGLARFASLLVILCLLIFGCEESSNIMDASNRDLSSSPANSSKQASAATTAWSPDDPLMPTGDCIQDTENLQAAIHHSNMSNGGTLYLGPGTFLVCATVVRHDIPGEFGYNAVPFNGTIQGAGKGVTIIKSVRGPGDAPFTPSFGFPITLAIWSLDYFGVRDLTFEADSEIADLWDIGWYPPTRGLLSYVNLGAGVYGSGNQYGTDCINVHFKGSLDSDGNPEIPLIFEVFGGGGGTHNAKSCDFENGSVLMLEYAEVGNTTINVGGSPREKVTFANTTDWQCLSISTWFCGDVTVNVSYIETHNTSGVLWNQTNPANSMSHFNLESNIVNMMPESWYAGVEMWAENFGEVSTVVTGNKFHSNSSSIFGPIMFAGVSSGLITNNKFTGWGPAAINVGFFEYPGTVALVGNNLQTWETAENPWVEGLYAPIWLGPNITNSIVVGGNNHENIWDLGQDNTYTGVNNMQQNIGQQIKDAMRQKAQAMKAMRGQ